MLHLLSSFVHPHLFLSVSQLREETGRPEKGQKQEQITDGLYDKERMSVTRFTFNILEDNLVYCIEIAAEIEGTHVAMPY